MKVAKPYKLLTFFCVFCVAVILSLAFAFTTAARADVQGSDYFSGGSVVFSNGKAEITFDETGVVSIDNKLDLSDFAITVDFPDMADGDEFTFVFTVDSFYATGNPALDGNGYETEIKNKVAFIMEGETLKASFNEQAATEVIGYQAGGALTVALNSADRVGYLSAKIYCGATGETELNYNPHNYYKIKLTPMTVGKVGFYGAADKKLNIISVNQKFGDGTETTYEDNKFVQDFVLTEDENASFAHKAYAKIYLPESFYDYDAANGVYKVICGYKYSATKSAYSLLGSSVSDYNIVSDEDVKVLSDGLLFKTPSNGYDDLKTLKIEKGEEEILSYDFYVMQYEKTTDKSAPVYDGDENAIASFKAYVNGLVEDAKDSTDKNLTIEKSKLASLVSDDYSSFALMTATVYYWSDSTNSSNSSSSSLKIPLKDAGHFRFVILFTDHAGNAMEQAQFFYSDAENPVIERYGVFEDYIFEFDFDIAATLSVTTGSTGTGYKGVEYSCSAFTIEGSDYSVKYNLYYSASEIAEDADGWKEIVAASSADDETKTYGDFSYDEIKAINYDGTLDFTPDRVGYYKFVCEVNSTDFIKGDKAAVTFQVKEQVKTVTPDTHWLQNNVWSVVFLSVGTLSLIGIIVLLFIKPKDDVSDDE